MIISKNHFVLYKGKMIQAQNLINQIKNIYKIKYNGELLYNIILENYDLINVNNLICETLHPLNKIAKLYLKELPLTN